jgi:hypothetical protein
MAMTFMSFSLFITLVAIFLMAIEIYEQYKQIQEIEETNRELRFNSLEDSEQKMKLNQKLTDISFATKMDDKGYPMIIVNKVKEILSDHESN